LGFHNGSGDGKASSIVFGGFEVLDQLLPLFVFGGFHGNH